jgi:hypothetical protein
MVTYLAAPDVRDALFVETRQLVAPRVVHPSSPEAATSARSGIQVSLMVWSSNSGRNDSMIAFFPSTRGSKVGR